MSAQLQNAQQVKCAYRNLYRALLQAVQYSKPARYVGRDKLRHAFREEDPLSFDEAKISRTVEFLQLAARERGLEHRLLKNLLFTAYWGSQSHQYPTVHLVQKLINGANTLKASPP